MPTEAPLTSTTTASTTSTSATATNQQSGPASLLNGVSVTHYSEQRGVMEKVNCPSAAVNIFSAEIKSPKLDNHARAAAENLLQLDTSPNVPTSTSTKNNNPFLNMSPQSPLTPTHISSKNPFKSTPPPNSPKISNAPNPFKEYEHDSLNGNAQQQLDQVDVTTVVVTSTAASITANNNLNATESTAAQCKMVEMNEKRVSFICLDFLMFFFFIYVLCILFL